MEKKLVRKAGSEQVDLFASQLQTDSAAATSVANCLDRVDPVSLD